MMSQQHLAFPEGVGSNSDLLRHSLPVQGDIYISWMDLRDDGCCRARH
jgi:hypothetical protein